MKYLEILNKENNELIKKYATESNVSIDEFRAEIYDTVDRFNVMLSFTFVKALNKELKRYGDQYGICPDPQDIIDEQYMY